MISLAGLKAGYYVYDNPGCDYGECSQSFVAIVAFKNNLAYELYFFGDAKLDQDEQKTLNSFKFITAERNPKKL